MTKKQRDELIEQFKPLLYKELSYAWKRVGKHICYADLVGYGWIGLLQALNRLDPNLESQWPGLVQQRIRGAITDGTRKMDPATRGLRRTISKFYRVKGELTRDLQRPVSVREVDDAAGITSLQRKIMNNYTSGRHIEAHWLQNDLLLPDYITSTHELYDIAMDIVSEMPERWQYVIIHTCAHEETLKEVGDQLGVSESTVGHVKAKALRRLRQKMEGMQ